MKNKNVHFSSTTDLWSTPQYIFDALNRIFHFDIDVCATAENAKCALYIDEQRDALNTDWHNIYVGSDERGFAEPPMCWMNPPYSQLKKWMKKAYEESQKGAAVVCLIPARTDTAAWHDYVMKASEVWLIRGRLKFGDQRNSAPFPSAVVVYEPDSDYGTPLFTAWNPVQGPPQIRLP
jgi:phage N-6-adenine-methyltransferase